MRFASSLSIWQAGVAVVQAVGSCYWLESFGCPSSQLLLGFLVVVLGVIGFIHESGAGECGPSRSARAVDVLDLCVRPVHTVDTTGKGTRKR